MHSPKQPHNSLQSHAYAVSTSPHDASQQLYPEESLPWLASEASALSVGPMPDQQLDQLQHQHSKQSHSGSEGSEGLRVDSAACPADSKHTSHAEHPGPSSAASSARHSQAASCSGGSQDQCPDSSQTSRELPGCMLDTRHLLQPDQALHWLSAEPSAVSVLAVVLTPAGNSKSPVAAEAGDTAHGTDSKVSALPVSVGCVSAPSSCADSRSASVKQWHLQV